jgi:LPS-assembly protein
MITITFKKITIIYLVINFIFLITILFAKANNEIDISAQKIFLDKDNDIINATGDVLIRNKQFSINSEEVIFYKGKKIIEANESVTVNDEYNNKYYSDNLISNDDFSEASAKKVKIRLKDKSRIVGSILKRKEGINIIKDSQYTPCIEKNYLIDNCPGWKLKAGTVYHDEKTRTMHYDHSTLYILNIPVLYTPYFSHPDPSVNKRSGLLAPSFQSDDKLGQLISVPYFYNLSENKDFTFTPTFQSTATNYLTSEFRLLNKNGIFNIETNINDNDDGEGTKHYIFADATLKSKIDKFDIYIQSSNNDTYMKKNQINEVDVLTSGVTISDTIKGNDFLFETKSYKHLSVSGSNQWEYLYPKLTYNITGFDLPNIKSNINIKNEILRLQALNKNITTSISSEINIDNQKIDTKRGYVFNNFIDTRLIYHSIENEGSSEDINQIRLFPQFGTSISMPLKKTKNDISQVLKPILMPILAPYNNYTDSLEVNNSNIFSRNRSSNLSEWESGPRINYGAEWFIDYKGMYNGNLIIGQSIKFNKEKSDTSDEISDIMTSFFTNFDKNIYTNAEFIIDRKKYSVNKSNITSSIYIKDFALKAEYDYVSNKFSAASEQLGLATKIKIKKDLDLIFSGKRDLNSKENIGYESGLFYENDCLAIDFKYYRDLTKFKDIEDTKGLSLSITLKPFGSSKSFGKSKTFGPQI